MEGGDVTGWRGSGDRWGGGGFIRRKSSGFLSWKERGEVTFKFVQSLDPGISQLEMHIMFLPYLISSGHVFDILLLPFASSYRLFITSLDNRSS